MCRPLDDYTNQELNNELARRCSLDTLAYEHDALAQMEDEGCPTELLAPIREWLGQPVTNAERLREWREWCEWCASRSVSPRGPL